jgi:hypothetical protein
MAVSKALSRSASQPAVFPPNKLLEKRIKQLTKGSGLFSGGSGSLKQEDDLDIIKQIIETDAAMSTTDSSASGCGDVETLRSQSLSHIPGQFPQTAGSLPSLPRAESMHILHANYNSAPDFMQFGKPFGCTAMGAVGHLQRDSQQTPFSGDSFQPPGICSGHSGLTGQNNMMGMPPGGVKGLDRLDVSRRNSLYESHSAAGTPVLTNESAQNTPHGAEPPFDFPYHQNSQLPGYSDHLAENRSSVLNAGEFGSGPLKKWGRQSDVGVLNVPSTFHYIVPGGKEGAESGDGTSGLLGRLQGTGLGGQGKEGDQRSPQLLSDYLATGSAEMGRAKPGEENQDSKLKGGGKDGVELDLFKGWCERVWRLAVGVRECGGWLLV